MSVTPPVQSYSITVTIRVPADSTKLEQIGNAIVNQLQTAQANGTIESADVNTTSQERAASITIP